MVAEPVRIPEAKEDKARTVCSRYYKEGSGGAALMNRLYSEREFKQPVDLIAEPVSFSMVGDLNRRKCGVSAKAYCVAANPSSDMTPRVAEPVNTAVGGGSKSHTIKAQYANSTIANFVTNGGFGATGVAERVEIKYE